MAIRRLFIIACLRQNRVLHLYRLIFRKKTSRTCLLRQTKLPLSLTLSFKDERATVSNQIQEIHTYRHKNKKIFIAENYKYMHKSDVFSFTLFKCATCVKGCQSPSSFSQSERPT